MIDSPSFLIALVAFILPNAAALLFWHLACRERDEALRVLARSTKSAGRQTNEVDLLRDKLELAEAEIRDLKVKSSGMGDYVHPVLINSAQPRYLAPAHPANNRSYLVPLDYVPCNSWTPSSGENF